MSIPIRLLVLDVDGVLSRGDLTFDDQGRESKTFNVKDGLGIKLLQRSGIEVAIITGRVAGAVAHRAKALGIEHVIQGREDKGAAFTELCSTLGLTTSECAYMGDDWPDLSAMALCGLSAAPANASTEVLSRVDWVSRFNGGEGAVRELCEHVLRLEGHYEALLQGYLTPTGVARMGS